ncbi:TlpA family protein disulfide reductase [Synoicihabitans lomoniglobus]|uniref:TlpA disulfide reductase family protein n=1 Tax=Synoicihabitans lomoniglobus TaxID=2909285 RepID=A0AAE9ZWS7_9BACT|nr:TlpA family protein disulfide reductase [Opitutaceae bacterium LMO-M01]WED64315.1 TlpA disulfide reductase family protein [Opitutaceae bacterium LMO-M01]
MKLLRLTLLSLLTSVVLGAASGPPIVPSDDPVEQELNALKAIMATPRAGEMTPRENYLWFDQLTRKLGAAAFAFVEAHPDDPRRWEAALILQQRRFHPRFVQSIDETYPEGGEDAVHRDTVAEAAFEARVVALETAMRVASDVPDEVMEQLEFGDLNPKFFPAYEAMRDGREPDLSTIEPAFLAFIKRWPESETGRGMLSTFVRLKMATAAAPTEEEVLAEFADSPNRHAREYVRDRLRFFELSKAPFELAFTAIDGRQVDLQKLRGKVVLIDFWATWCGPCIAELPNVKRVFADYHDKGFEIISVSLDAERDRQKFIDLVEEEGTTWPQRFEGKGWKDPLVARYTISGIPAMFLLDQDGMLVSTNARGPKLESEVKRLLGL